MDIFFLLVITHLTPAMFTPAVVPTDAAMQAKLWCAAACRDSSPDHSAAGDCGTIQTTVPVRKHLCARETKARTDSVVSFTGMKLPEAKLGQGIQWTFIRPTNAWISASAIAVAGRTRPQALAAVSGRASCASKLTVFQYSFWDVQLATKSDGTYYSLHSFIHLRTEGVLEYVQTGAYNYRIIKSDSRQEQMYKFNLQGRNEFR